MEPDVYTDQTPESDPGLAKLFSEVNCNNNEINSDETNVSPFNNDINSDETDVIFYKNEINSDETNAILQDNDANNEQHDANIDEHRNSGETDKLLNNLDDISIEAVIGDDNIIKDNAMENKSKDMFEFDKKNEMFDPVVKRQTRTRNKCCGCCVCICCHKKSTKKKVQKRSDGRYEKTRCERCKICCKRFLAFLFSRIGMCSLVVAYAILGGFIFKEIEAPEEEVIRHQVQINRKNKVDKLWNVTMLYNVFSPQNWSKAAEAILLEFQTEIYIATKEKGWDGHKEDGELQWTFSSSLLYSITVISTIGYGNVAPKTSLGRLITIVYAIFGIPLTLLCLANLGSSMGNCFRFLYKHFCKMVICLCCPSQAQWYAKRRSKNLSNIPAGDIQLDSKQQLQNRHHGKEDPVRVPIFVSLLLIASYILSGAVIFSTWEENWNLLIGSYFCFITLSTIGFGDFVPGSNSGSFDNQEKMIICSVYLIFGLSMIAMCFNLMQEEVRAKFRWLGQKIGIIDEKA